MILTMKTSKLIHKDKMDLKYKGNLMRNGKYLLSKSHLINNENNQHHHFFLKNEYEGHKLTPLATRTLGLTYYACTHDDKATPR